MKLRRAPIESLEVDDLVFAVRWSRRRRTIGISVAREGGLRVLAPAGVPARKLESAVRAKLPWVLRKLDEFERLDGGAPQLHAGDPSAWVLSPYARRAAPMGPPFGELTDVVRRQTLRTLLACILPFWP